MSPNVVTMAITITLKHVLLILAPHLTVKYVQIPCVAVFVTLLSVWKTLIVHTIAAVATGNLLVKITDVSVLIRFQ